MAYRLILLNLHSASIFFFFQNTTEQFIASITHIPESEKGFPSAVEVNEEQKGCGCLPPAATTVLTQMFDFSLFKSPTFILLSTAGMLSLLSLFVPFYFLPSYISKNADKFGLDEDAVSSVQSFIMSLIGICNTIGRLIAGWISDRPKVDAILVNNIALIVGGLATCLLPVISSVSLLYVYGVLFGFSVAFFASLRSILLVELLGLEKLTNSFGLLLLVQGVAATFGAPIAGGFADATGGFSTSFYVFGFIYAFSGAVCFPLRKLKTWEENRSQKEDNEV